RRENSPMQFSQALPDHTAQGAIYLRWRLEARPLPRLQRHLENLLQPLCEEARQAGVEVSFSASGHEWLLKMTGLQEPMPSVLEQVLKDLTTPLDNLPEQEPNSPALMPIRQLLKAMPDQCLEHTGSSADAQHLWSSARWE